MKVYDSHYINGQWVKAQSSQTFPVHDSTTEEVIATVPQGSAAEAEQAVLAARAAFDAWSQTPLEDRCTLIDKVVEGLKARAEEMAVAIAREVGMPIKLARMVQVGGWLMGLGYASWWLSPVAWTAAPVALVVTIERGMGAGCFMDLGMCLYGLMLAAQSRGLATCAIGALASYPGLVRRTLGLDERSLVLLLEEAGRAALPHPVVETAAVAAPSASSISVRKGRTTALTRSSSCSSS